MKKLRNWFIGKYLAQTTNVFERARAELLFNFSAFYLLNLLLFIGNLIANGYHYHTAIISYSICLLITILIAFKKQVKFKVIALLLFTQQITTGIISFLIQESSMDFVGEFWMMVNILITFFTLGKTYGFVMSGVWFVQLIHCLLNDFSKGQYILIDMPDKEVLPPAPFFVMVPFFLCIYIVYQFVKTRSFAERDIQEQKRVIEDKNHEILSSIRYAKRIQTSLLPTEKLIQKILAKKSGK